MTRKKESNEEFSERLCSEALVKIIVEEGAPPKEAPKIASAFRKWWRENGEGSVSIPRSAFVAAWLQSKKSRSVYRRA